MDVRELLSQGRVLVLDGAMGTELDRRGYPMGGQNCIDAPEGVGGVHASYVEAGTDFIITNTLTMNGIYLKAHGLDICGADVNRAGVEIAKGAAGTGVAVLGDMSSTGQMLEPYGTYSVEQFIDTYKEQAHYLADAGCAGFIIETMFDLREAVSAVKACIEVSDLPVFASMSFTTVENGGRTIMGNTAAACAHELQEAGASVIGTNCGDLDPHGVADIIKLLRPETDLPLMAQPNAGIPKMVDGKAVYDLSPNDFAAGIAQCIENGATLVGGCCGTSPDHIRAIVAIAKV